MANRDGRDGRDGRPGRDGRDGVDTWLHDRIEPLPPPPGTFEAIRRRARRRKVRKLAVSVGAAAAIIAAAVTVPQVVQLPIQSGKTEAGSTPVNSTQATTPAGTSGVATSSKSAIPTVTGNPVPTNFRPSSLTAVSATAVFTIGQASTPGHCVTQYCTSVARTQDGGAIWSGLPAPLTGAPDGATGVGQIRFLEGINGWAFGPELWATHDGARTPWTAINTHGQRVIDVETVGNRAFAIEATCTGSGPDFAAQCTSFTLYSTLATANSWTKVGATTTNLTPAGTGSSTGSAALVLTGTRGYLLAPDGTLYAGPVDGTAAWRATSAIPCDTGQPQANGQPAGALLGAVTAQNLILDCTQNRLIYVSSNAGKSWQQMWTAPTAATATSIAASPAYSVVLATDQGIYLLPSQNASWQSATLSGTAPATGFSYVGMTNDTHGMALPADPASGTVWFTTDSGQAWSPARVQGP
ncbi:MAG TPA: hypothetical protein VF060_07515 [Trebonia sp.]